MLPFRNRDEAGRWLAYELKSQKFERPIVLALPRGGVPVACPIAKALHAPLDIWIVRKIGFPRHEELGLGAVAEGGQVYLNEHMIGLLGLSEQELAPAVERKRRDVEERVRKLRRGAPAPELRGRSVILVDDGMATGGTARAAVDAIRAQHPKQLLLAVPVAAAEAVRDLMPVVDRVLCLMTPPALVAVGEWYEDFHQLTDDDVLRLLDAAKRNTGGNAEASQPARH